MKEIKEGLNKVMGNVKSFMANAKKQNPNANWANLLTGAAVLVMVAVFSYAYFVKSKGGNVVIDDSGLVNEVTNSNPSNSVDNQGSGTTGNESSENTPSDTGIPAEPGEKGAAPVGETTIVQKGEGLWQVAQRVCGDGEKYNILANANGLNVWEGLNEGMTLKVVCN